MSSESSNIIGGIDECLPITHHEYVQTFPHFPLPFLYAHLDPASASTPPSTLSHCTPRGPMVEKLFSSRALRAALGAKRHYTMRVQVLLSRLWHALVML